MRKISLILTWEMCSPPLAKLQGLVSNLQGCLTFSSGNFPTTLSKMLSLATVLDSLLAPAQTAIS